MRRGQLKMPEITPEQRLAYAKFIGGLPLAAQTTAEAHAGLTCHKDIMGGHFWIQVFHDDGTVWLLHGRDSTLPGLDLKNHDPDDLSICDCGNWMPATKEQMLASRTLVATIYQSGRKH